MVALILSIAAVVLGCIALTVAVWELKRLRREVDARRRESLEIRRQLDRQGLIANEVAHELKNPITAIVCAAESLELMLDAELDDSSRRTLRHIRDYGDHILKMMQDFIDLTRGIAGSIVSIKKLTRASDCIEPVVGLLGPSAAKRGVVLEVESESPCGWVYIDQKHLKQIVFNLVENAVKFTPAGGAVVVRLAKTECALVMEVSDNGPGMTDHQLDRLFDPAQRPIVWEGGEKGNGLGLLLTKTLVELEGGEILITSALGLGTSITVSFPLCSPLAVEHEAVPQPETTRPLEGQSILLVDSDPGVRDTLLQLIKTLGGVADGVSVAADAVDAMSRGNYSAIMVDDSLCGEEGKEILERLRREAAACNTRFVVASSRPLLAHYGAELHADHLVEKPLDRRRLLESLLQTH